MTIKNTYKFFALLTLIFMSFSVVSCSSEESVLEPDANHNDAIRIIAAVAQEIMTRTEGETVYVRDGVYNLSYMKDDNQTWDVASVDFNKEGFDAPGVGIVTVTGGDELRWLNVGGGATPTFYLDNVSAANGTTGSTLTDIVLPETNPYRAAVFDPNVNDLLWSSSMVRRNDKNINFDLHHNMSRLRVEVTVDRTNATTTAPLDLDNATVKITSLNQIPVSYNRLDGTLSLPSEQESYTDLTLVIPGDASCKWSSTVIDEENPLITTYKSVDFVLPPQELLPDEGRPRLVISLPNPDGTTTTYTGIIPHAMLVDDNDHLTPSYPLALSFLKEHILTIRTKITEEPPTLEFMPVTVVKWVDKGEFTVEAHQAGIYMAQEFYNLIAYYQAGNEYQLSRYGRFTQDPDISGKPTGDPYWHFDFFHSVVLDYNKIHGQMIPGGDDHPKFTFVFNGYSVFVSNGADSDPVQVSQDELYRIVTGVSGMPTP